MRPSGWRQGAAHLMPWRSNIATGYCCEQRRYEFFLRPSATMRLRKEKSRLHSGPAGGSKFCCRIASLLSVKFGQSAKPNFESLNTLPLEDALCPPTQFTNSFFDFGPEDNSLLCTQL